MITNLTLGGQSLISQQWNLQAFRNGSFPATVYTKSKRGGYQGSKLVTPTFASYQFVADWQIVGTDFADLCLQRDLFLGILATVHSDGAQTLVITNSDGSMRQISIKAIQVTGDIDTDSANSAFVEVTFEAEYPFLQSYDLKTEDILIFNGGGFAIPFGVPLDMSAGASTEAILTNAGNYQAYPIFTFVGPLTNPTIENLTTGKSLSLTYTLSADTDKIIIDTYLRTVIIEPSGNVGRQYVSGDFWTVDKGDNEIQLTAGVGESGKCTVSFRDTFLNI